MIIFGDTGFLGQNLKKKFCNDHSMKETSFNAQTKKTIGMAVKYILTGQNLSEHLPFEEIVQKTIPY
jgi:hypothetical protein